MTSPALVWLRRDLRLADHAAFRAAEATGRPIVAAYILDDESSGPQRMGAASRWWLHHSLGALAAAIAARGGRLILRRGACEEELPKLARDLGAAEIHTGIAIEPWARPMLRRLADSLGIPLHRHLTTLLHRPDQPRTQAGGPFMVFTPYSKACLAAGDPLPPAPPPARLAAPDIASDTLADWSLLPTTPDWAAGLRTAWSPGESGATAALAAFARAAAHYARDRDRPDLPATSRLSPHLAFGEISPRAVWHAVEGAKYRAELLWREFSAHLLWHHESLPDTPLRPAFAAMPWRDDPAALRAWQRGRTGIPIVDAGMRELWTTGWMHNRVRMIVASLLVKHLLIDWRAGAAWFWDTLVDADLASNSASWQWVAGSGADAAPYFRIFNPVLQGRKFDPDGAYVRRWVPELAALDPRHIHAPWEAPSKPRAYPAPIVDLAEGRARALAAFAALGAGGLGGPPG